MGILFGLFAFNLSAQSGLKSALIPFKSGAVLAYSDDSKAFTLSFITKNIHRNIDKGSYRVNGFELTPFTTDILNANKNESVKKQKQRITRDIASSMDHTRAELDERRLAQTSEWESIDERLYCFWYYKLPDSDKQTLHVTTICNNYFFTVGAITINKAEFDQAKALLTGLMNDIKLYDEALDFNALYQKLNK